MGNKIHGAIAISNKMMVIKILVDLLIFAAIFFFPVNASVCISATSFTKKPNPAVPIIVIKKSGKLKIAVANGMAWIYIDK